METARIFKNGRSQAVRLPKKYWFATAEVRIRREGKDIVLSPFSWVDALEAFLAMPKCPDFEPDREAAQRMQERDWF